MNGGGSLGSRSAGMVAETTFASTSTPPRVVRQGRSSPCGHDAGERQLIAMSLTEFIEIIVADAEAGDLVSSDEWGGVYVPDAE